MEHRVSPLEKWTSKHGRIIAHMRADIATMKESRLDMQETKEMLKDHKKIDKMSEGGENSFNEQEK